MIKSAGKQLADLIGKAGKKGTTAYDTTAQVVRADEDTLWVHIPGGVDETPVRKTVSALPGDSVQVRVSGGRAWVTGNKTAPPTDDRLADEAIGLANQASDKVVRLKEVVVEGFQAARAKIGELEVDTAKIHDLTADIIHAATAYIDDLRTRNITTEDIAADHATIGDLDVTYANIDAANISDLSAKSAWIDKLMVQTGLVAHHGTVYELDAIQVNASKIKAGTLDVERLIVTVGSEKYLIHVDPSTGTPSYEKLEGGIIEDNTIVGDKLVTETITTREITAENLVGTNGWINLHQGKFFFTTNGTTWANTSNGIMWDGTNLKIKGDISITAGNVYTKTQTDTALSGKVGNNEVITKINASSEGVQIKADKVNIEGATIFSSGRLSQTSLNNAYDAKGAASSAETNAKAYADSLDSKARPFVIGTQSAATGTWTGVCSELSELKDGQEILYYLPFAGSGNATLNLTLSGGSTTGAKNCYYQGTSRLTTHFGAGMTIPLVYHKSLNISGTVYEGWWTLSQYNTNTYDRKYHNNAIKAATAITADRIVCGTASGYKKIGASIAFDLGYPLLYSPNAIAADATRNDTYDAIPNINFSNNGTIQSGTTYKMLYLKGSVSGNTFTIAASNFLTTTIPTSADSMFYIPLGIMSSATNGYFESSNRLYAYLNGAFQAVDTAANAIATAAKATADAAAPKTSAVSEEQLIYISKASGTSSVSGTTTWITETGDKQNTWSTKRPTYSSSYPVLFIAKQKKTVSGTVTCTTPLKDDTTTIIDGGHITTGTIDASKATITNINATNITTGTLSADRIATGALAIGKLNTDTQTKITNGNTAYNRATAYRGVCSTAAGTAAKVVTCANFPALAQGISVTIYNTTANTVNGAITLNVNSTGAKTVHVNGYATSTMNNLYWKAGSTMTFIYDGTYWRLEQEITSRYAHVGQSSNTDNVSAKPWFKVGSLVANGSNVDYYITFHVEYYPDNQRNGKLRVRVRTDGNRKISPSSCSINWIALSDQMSQHLDDFVLAYKADTADSTVELWAKVNTNWGSYNFKVEDESTRVYANMINWQLYDTTTDGGYASITSGYTQIKSVSSIAYITYVNASTGIRVHNAGDATDFVQVNSSGISFYRNSVLRSQWQDNWILLGESDKSRVTIGTTAGSGYVFIGDENNIGRFRADSSGVNIGNSAKEHVYITDTALSMYDGGNVRRIYLDASSGVVVGRSDKGHATINDNGLHIYDSSNAKAAETTANGLVLYKAGSKRAAVTANGLDIFGNDGSTSIASFGSTARIGSGSAKNVYIDANGTYIRNGSTVLSEFTPTGASLGKNSNTAKIKFCNEHSYIEGGYDSTNKTASLQLVCESNDTAANLPNAADIFIEASSAKNGTGYIDIAPDEVYIASGNNETAFAHLSLSYAGGLELTTDDHGDNQAWLKVKSFAAGSSAGVWIGIGQGGDNHGVWSETKNRWLIATKEAGYVFSPGVYANTTSGGSNVRVETSGTGYLKRYASSSRRYKSDIDNLKNDLLEASRLYGLRAVQFRYRDDYLDEDDQRYGKLVSGFIAEEVYEAYPIAVNYEDGQIEDWEPKYIIPPMLKLIQDQKKEIDELRARIYAMEVA